MAVVMEETAAAVAAAEIRMETDCRMTMKQTLERIQITRTPMAIHFQMATRLPRARIRWMALTFRRTEAGMVAMAVTEAKKRRKYRFQSQLRPRS